MSKRPPSPPPDLAGYTVTRLIGSGGFADVYLYAQTLPRRNVAIKVLVPDATDDEVIAQFNAEANLMAALSTHPAIVTIYQAGLAPDGRPYLVMEYCSRPNLATRYRAERLSVAEVLRIGARIAGAVETAHRAGILHRDIKPANVLTTDFGHPVLSDFGISVSRGAPQAAAGAVGMSIPWTAPEMFTEGATGDERADVYSLAATLYTVLARRSPFDRPGGPNRSADLIGRIRSAPVPALGRSDVPPSLERLLARAMDKNPAARPASALDFARGLQRVETELGLAPTPIDVLAEEPDDSPADAEQGAATRIRSLTVIDPAPAPVPMARSGAHDILDARWGLDDGGDRGAMVGPAGYGATDYVGGAPESVPPSWAPGTDTVPRDAVPGLATFPVPAGTVSPAEAAHHAGPAGRAGSGVADRAGSSGSAASSPTAPAGTAMAAASGARPRSRPRLPLLVGGGTLIVVAALVTTLLLTRGSAPPAAPDHTGDTLTTMSSPNDPLGGGVPQPADLRAQGTSDGVTFSWRNPDPQPGDRFQWYRTDSSSIVRHLVDDTTVTVPGTGSVCIAVVLVRSDGTSSPQPATGCGRPDPGTS